MATEEPPSPVSIPDCPGSADLLTEGSNNESDSEKAALADDNQVPTEMRAFKTRADNDATAGTEGEDALKEDQTLVEKHDVNSPKKKHFEKFLIDRIGVAIEKAIAAGSSDFRASSVALGEKDAPRYIKAKFASSDWYIIPWEACFSWEVVEVLLKQWFCESEQCLLDIANGDLSVSNDEDDFIHPRTWETVVTHNSAIKFWPHSEFSSSLADDDDQDKKNYENRIQYTVNYYQKNSSNDKEYFMGSSSNKEPVLLEVTDDNSNLPALEEIKTIMSPHHSNAGKKGDGSGEKKTKLGPHDRVIDTSLKINSPYLLNILKSLVEYSANTLSGDTDGLGLGLFYHPYRDLYHHLPDLLKYKSDTTELRNKHTEAFNQKYDQHADLLYKYLTSQTGIAFEGYKTRLERKVPVVTFSTCWLLLKPGTEVYVREDDGSLNAYIVDFVTGGVSEKDGKRTNDKYEVQVWNLMFNGERVQTCLRYVDINVFDNEREITSLPCFPARFIDDTDEGKLEEKLVQRGESYFAYCKSPTFLQYTGKGLKTGSKTYKQARVVVEHATRPWVGLELENNHHIPKSASENIQSSIRIKRCECKDCREASDTQEVYEKEPFSDYHDIIPSESTVLGRSHFKIMASHMYGFMLKDREYGLEQPKVAENTIDSLVMESSNKELIKAIAKIYTDRDQSARFSADFIHGKGGGQIILLHGPPGTGKTLTAESVAEYTKRPLLSITAADLGHEPDPLEQSLLRYFKRATDWDAIVLLDEADVYLEQRSTRDLKRNSIVSVLKNPTVFLRALDYFQGILFLTTNRVGHFDEAFMSRIHLSLGYELLNDESRSKIWDNLFKKLREDHKRGGPQINYEYDAKSFVKSHEVQVLKWNGREIRNGNVDPPVAVATLWFV
ncbi:P-loop containing nucleoside triphosphate hydrolase protein [Stemphylium lycopersici]|uniref:P-loop containing nucleoside triphosphate hydrolase protein n=1 Tax=Stemphylium lycopersici TaxID=183478 RepID=A0A364NH46_STELY|nr:P-loop containing nucleoside triphosphate hydrolase protein [Stemphylium lycopersici]